MQLLQICLWLAFVLFCQFFDHTIGVSPVKGAAEESAMAVPLANHDEKAKNTAPLIDEGKGEEKDKLARNQASRKGGRRARKYGAKVGPIKPKESSYTYTSLPLLPNPASNESSAPSGGKFMRILTTAMAFTGGAAAGALGHHLVGSTAGQQHGGGSGVLVQQVPQGGSAIMPYSAGSIALGTANMLGNNSLKTAVNGYHLANGLQTQYHQQNRMDKDIAKLRAQVHNDTYTDRMFENEENGTANDPFAGGSSASLATAKALADSTALALPVKHSVVQEAAFPKDSTALALPPAAGEHSGPSTASGKTGRFFKMPNFVRSAAATTVGAIGGAVGTMGVLGAKKWFGQQKEDVKKPEADETKSSPEKVDHLKPVEIGVKMEEKPKEFIENVSRVHLEKSPEKVPEKENNPAAEDMATDKSLKNGDGDVNNLAGTAQEKLSENTVENQQPNVEHNGNGKIVEQMVGSSNGNGENTTSDHANSHPLNMEHPKIVEQHSPSYTDGKNNANDPFKQLYEKLEEISTKQNKVLDIFSGLNVVRNFRTKVEEILDSKLDKFGQTMVDKLGQHIGQMHSNTIGNVAA